MRFTRQAAILALATLTLALSRAQTPPRDERAADSPTGTIHGRVVAEATGAPLRNARVDLRAGDASVHPVLTDAEGRFAGVALPAGQYTLSVKKAGYATTTFGARGLGEPATRITVTEATRVDGIEVRMPKGAAISGRVVDAFGEPAVGTLVTIESTTETAGRPAIAITTRIDDLGEYRVGGLPAGSFMLSAAAFDSFLVALVRASGPDQASQVEKLVSSRQTRVYYPGALRRTDAQPIVIAAGEERSGLDFLISSSSATPPSIPRTDAEYSGRLRGRILRADGRPLPGAQVSIVQTSSQRDGRSPLNLNVTSDEAGRYEFTKLRPAAYRVTANRSGYGLATFGESASGGRAQTVTVDVNATRNGVDITLARQGAVTGRVVDEYGDPVELARVTVLQTQYISGRRRLREIPGVSAAQTNDLGRYRVHGVPAGDYFVSVVNQRELDGGARVIEATSLPIAGYAATYYPGTANPSQAHPVAVVPSQDIQGVDVPLQRVPTARITGRVLNARGEPARISGSVQTGSDGQFNATAAEILLIPSQRSHAVIAAPIGARARNLKDGTFEFTSVPPGEYVIQASSPQPHPSEEGDFASQFIFVNGTDINDLVLRKSRGSTISGKVTFEGARPPSTYDIELTPSAVDLDRSPIARTPARTWVGSDFTFEFTGVSGPRRLTVLGTPDGWSLKGIYLNGTDVTDTPLPFGTESQSIRDLEVVLTTRGAAVSGSVTDDRGIRMTDYTAILFAVDRALWYTDSRFLKRTVPETDGTFVLRGVTPGQYFVAAVDRVPGARWQDPAFLDSLAPFASRVTLAEGQQLSVAPKLLR